VARGASLIVAALVWLAAFSSVARAVVSLNWNTCAAPVGTPLQTFACDTNAGTPLDLIIEMNPFTLMSNVSIASVLLSFSSDQATVPDWWQIQPGGCRAADFAIAPDPPFPAGCADPWLGGATMIVDFLQACDPRGMLLSLRATVPAGAPLTLAPGNRYAMFRLRFSRGHTSGADACGGCSAGACLAIDGISITTAAGGFSDSPGNFVRWQSAGSCASVGFCGPTPTNRPTWGSVKSLYR